MIADHIATIGAHRAQTAAYWRRRAREAQIFHSDSAKVRIARIAAEFESLAVRAEKIQQSQHC